MHLFSNMEEFVHSPFLFQQNDGSEMRFSMPPCPLKAKLKAFINHGGGVLTSKYDGGAIRIAVPGARLISSDCISASYIEDCVKQNKLLPMDKYRLPLGEQDGEISEISSDDYSPARHIIKLQTKRKQGRQKYQICEDMDIIKFLLTEGHYMMMGGNRLWKTAEHLKVTKHSWQSMRDRFHKHILPNIKSYPMLKPSEIGRLTQQPYVANSNGPIQKIVPEATPSNAPPTSKEMSLQDNLPSDGKESVNCSELSSRRTSAKKAVGMKEQSPTRPPGRPKITLNLTDTDQTSDTEGVHSVQSSNKTASELSVVSDSQESQSLTLPLLQEAPSKDAHWTRDCTAGRAVSPAAAGNTSANHVKRTTYTQTSDSFASGSSTFKTCPSTVRRTSDGDDNTSLPSSSITPKSTNKMNPMCQFLFDTSENVLLLDNSLSQGLSVNEDDDHIQSMRKVMEKTCNWLGLSMEQLWVVLYRFNGSLEKAVTWMLTMSGKQWLPEDDERLLNGNSEDYESLEKTYGREQMLRRQQFLANFMK